MEFIEPTSGAPTRCRGRPHEACSEHRLPDHRRGRADRGPGKREPGRALRAEDGDQEERGQEGAGELRCDVAGQARPGKVAAHREREAHAGVEVRAGHGPHKQDDRADHEPGRRHERRLADDVAAEPGIDHPSARGHEHEEERSEHLAEEAPPFVGVARLAAEARALVRMLIR